MYYWPRMTCDITWLVEKCEACQRMRPSQCRKKQQPSAANFPMEMVCANIFEFNTHHYLIMVDRYSAYPWIHQLRHLNTEVITSTLHGWFLQYGFPPIIRMDGGPQFCQDFKKFCQDCNIQPELSSLHNAQSNGHAEAAVKNMKYLLSKCGTFSADFQKCLCEWCNSPATSQDSPNQLFFGRTLRTALPALDEVYWPRHNSPLMRAQEGKNVNIKDKFDHQAKNMKPLKTGQKVQIQDHISKKWDIFGAIVNQCNNSKSCTVLFPNGRQKVCNKWFLKPVCLKNTPPSKEEDSTSSDTYLETQPLTT